MDSFQHDLTHCDVVNICNNEVEVEVIEVVVEVLIAIVVEVVEVVFVVVVVAVVVGAYHCST